MWEIRRIKAGELAREEMKRENPLVGISLLNPALCLPSPRICEQGGSGVGTPHGVKLGEEPPGSLSSQEGVAARYGVGHPKA